MRRRKSSICSSGISIWNGRISVAVSIVLLMTTSYLVDAVLDDLLSGSGDSRSDDAPRWGLCNEGHQSATIIARRLVTFPNTCPAERRLLRA